MGDSDNQLEPSKLELSKQSAFVSPKSDAIIVSCSTCPEVVTHIATKQQIEIQIFSSKRNRSSTKSSQNKQIDTTSSDELSSDSSSPRPVNRVSHNNLERRRRDELKRKFDDLRQCIPDIYTNGKTAKVVILKKAKDLIYNLELQERNLLVEKQLAQSINLILSKKLTVLSQCPDVMKFYY